jgi:histidyl-tRNA synthetase
MRAQMREANRQNARYTLLLGDNEIATGTIALKDMESSTQETLPMAEIVRRLKVA